MFYSHEILTQRKYGIATIWLAATIGIKKSGVRKFQRKEILAVDVPKACDAVVYPQAPLALRLQSNLLVGISRVYNQQYEYFYHDVSAAHANLKGSDAGPQMTDINLAREAKPEALVLGDDPGFNIEFLPEYLLDFELRLDRDQESLASSGLTPKSQKKGPRATMPNTLLAELRNFSDRGIDYSVLSSDPPPGRSGLRLGQIEEDPGFEFDEDGELRDVIRDISRSPHLPPVFKTQTGPEGRIGSDDIAERVLQEHEKEADTQMHHPNGLMPVLTREPSDTYEAYPNSKRKQFHLKNIEGGLSKQGPEVAEGVAGSLRRAHPRRAVIDNATKYPLSTLATWRDEYPRNMETRRKKNRGQEFARKAKAVARILIFDYGAGGRLDNTILRSTFSGQAILSRAFGLRDGGIVLKGPKRASVGGRLETRGRLELPSVEEAGEFGVGIATDATEQAPEVRSELGREGQQLFDAQSFAGGTPWSQPLSDQRLGRAGYSSIGGFASSEGELANLVSGQAIQYSGTPTPKDRRGVERLSVFGLPQQLGIVEEGNEVLPSGADDGVAAGDNIDAFEHFAGKIAARAAGIEWVDEVLERESEKFLDYVKFRLDQARKRRAGANFVAFDELVQDSRSRRIVAVQALQHVLFLATRHKLLLRQDEPYGLIRVGIV